MHAVVTAAPLDIVVDVSSGTFAFSCMNAAAPKVHVGHPCISNMI